MCRDQHKARTSQHYHGCAQTEPRGESGSRPTPSQTWRHTWSDWPAGCLKTTPFQLALSTFSFSNSFFLTSFPTRNTLHFFLNFSHHPPPSRPAYLPLITRFDTTSFKILSYYCPTKVNCPIDTPDTHPVQLVQFSFIVTRLALAWKIGAMDSLSVFVVFCASLVDQKCPPSGKHSSFSRPGRPHPARHPGH